VKLLKVLAIILIIYVGIVVLFESLIGYFQPDSGATLVITTTDENGEQNDRVLSRLESSGRLYVAANHWPRNWFNQALENPAVTVTIDGKAENYLAVPASTEEHERLNTEQPLPLVVRLLTGFPPRYFVRLDPARAEG
jgi:hypothetical protein